MTESGIGATTTYTYDALDNLTGVTQLGVVGRSFSYSSLGRLTSATNPETGPLGASGTSTSAYDGDGNLFDPHASGCYNQLQLQ